MQDAITNVINKSDVQGLYLDTASMSNLESYFASGELRVRAAATISANASAIIRDAVAKALLYSDITRPGGNMYTTRRYAACIRDLDYYLRYSTYAMLAGDTSILDERVLNHVLRLAVRPQDASHSSEDTPPMLTIDLIEGHPIHLWEAPIGQRVLWDRVCVQVMPLRDDDVPAPCKLHRRGDLIIGSTL